MLLLPGQSIKAETATSVIKTLFSLTRTKIKQNNCAPTWFCVKNSKSVFVAAKVDVRYCSIVAEFFQIKGQTVFSCAFVESLNIDSNWVWGHFFLPLNCNTFSVN